MLNRPLTGAHYGLRDWLGQRLTAAVMAAYSLGLMIWLVLHPAAGYDQWTAWFASNPLRVFTLLFLCCLHYHAWIGVRDIVMDYIKPASLRLALHACVIIALLLEFFWSLQILNG